MFTLLQQDQFTSDGSGKILDLPGSADYVRVFNKTQAATQQGTGRGVVFEWYKNDSTDGGWKYGKEDSDDILNLTQLSSGGFKYVTSFPAPEAAVTGSAITDANPAVITMTNSFSDGDRVILYSTTGMLQIGGMSFDISSVSGSNFTLLGLDASGFAAAATNVVARRIPDFLQIKPQFLYVTAISQASSAEITVSYEHDYVVGQKVHFSVPDSFGMSEIDGLEGTITAATGTNSPAGSSVYKFVVDIDSSSFSAFAFPASSGSPTERLFATVSPAGQSPGKYPIANDPLAPFRTPQAFPYMYLSAGAQSPAGSSDDVIVWQAWKKEN